MTESLDTGWQIRGHRIRCATTPEHENEQQPAWRIFVDDRECGTLPQLARESKSEMLRRIVSWYYETQLRGPTLVGAHEPQ